MLVQSPPFLAAGLPAGNFSARRAGFGCRDGRGPGTTRSLRIAGGEDGGGTDTALIGVISTGLHVSGSYSLKRELKLIKLIPPHPKTTIHLLPTLISKLTCLILNSIPYFPHPTSIQLLRFQDRFFEY
jgi:hypothetical protein